MTDISVSQLCGVAGQDIPRLQTVVAKTLIQNPFVDLIEGEYAKQHALKPRRGCGPRVLMNGGYRPFKDSYLAAQDSLTRLILRHISWDIQAQLYLNGRHKFNLVAGSQDSKYTRGMKFFEAAPNRFPQFEDIQKAKKLLTGGREFADGTTCRVLGAPDLISSLLQGRPRRQTRMLHPALGEPCHSWHIDIETGIGFGTTNPGAVWKEDGTGRLGAESFRASEFYSNGYLKVLTPHKVVESGKALYSILDPLWLCAPWEVFFVIGAPNLSRRNVRISPVNPHLSVDLDWHYQRDSGDNIFGDYGWHKYEVSRDYTAVCPGNVVAVLYRRLI